MLTPAQLLRSKIIKKVEYKGLLEEEITEMVKAHVKLSNKELNKKYNIDGRTKMVKGRK